LARELTHIEGQRLDELARTLLAPDDELRWRLFHLAVLGEVIAVFKDIGATLRSLAPLGEGESSSGPSFTATLPDGELWEIWFEAAGIWRHLETPQPYRAVRNALETPSLPLGADLLIVDGSGSRGLFVECKFSGNSTVVGRDGYHQATTYLLEAAGRLLPSVVSVVVGPSNMITGPELMKLGQGYVGFARPQDLAVLINGAVTSSGPFV
jgi:hypothetical protein